MILWRAFSKNILQRQGRRKLKAKDRLWRPWFLVLIQNLTVLA